MYKIKGENRKNSTQYIGVTFSRKKWRSRISHNGEERSLGLYDNPKDAAKAYDLYVIKNNLDRETNFFKKKLV